MFKTQSWLFLALAAHAVHLGSIAAWQSPVWDEVGHVPAGISHWKLGRFDLYRVNPPLPRMIAALPILPLADTDWQHYDMRPMGRSEFSVGRDFMSANGPRSGWLFVYARWAGIPFSLLGGFVCFLWARELFGKTAGWLALLLWCLSPMVLAWGSVVMPDLPAAACGVAALYLYRKWTQSPNWTWAYVAGLAVGVALLTKMTWVVLAVVLPLLSVTVRCSSWRQRWRAGTQFVLIGVVALGVVNLGYGFEGTGKRLGDFAFRSRVLSTTDPGAVEARDASGNRFVQTIWAGIRIPLPSNYVQGLDYIKWEYEVGYYSYLRGVWRKGGWWYYYLYGLVIKEPLGTWCLLGLAMVLWWIRPGRYRCDWREEWLLAVPFVAIFVGVSSQSGFNHHLRYVLPSLPLLFIWISRVGRLLDPWCSRLERVGLEENQGTQLKIVEVHRRHGHRSLLASALPLAVVGFTLWMGVRVLTHSPWYIGYFNEAVGIRNGYRHLTNSNVDFGQGLWAIRAWLAEHGEGRPVFLAHSVPMVDPALFGIQCSPMPRRSELDRLRSTGGSGSWRDILQPGWYVIGASSLNSRFGAYDYLRGLQPREYLAASVLVYFIGDDEIELMEKTEPEYPPM